MPDKQENTLDAVPDRLVEAARYALLRRLAFAMRHHMVVHLQPIGMITEVMERRLQSPSPDLGQMRESMTKINGYSRAAVQSCLDVVSWLAPEDGATVALDAGVDECLALLRSGFAFRGFTLKDEVGGVSLPVGRAGLRNVLPACLLALTDHAASPADVLLSAQRAQDRSCSRWQCGPARAPPGSRAMRCIACWSGTKSRRWHAADGIALDRSGEQIRITIPAA